jgi:hypothetical protein
MLALRFRVENRVLVAYSEGVKIIDFNTAKTALREKQKEREFGIPKHKIDNLINLFKSFDKEWNR